MARTYHLPASTWGLAIRLSIPESGLPLGFSTSLVPATTMFVLLRIWRAVK